MIDNYQQFNHIKNVIFDLINQIAQNLSSNIERNKIDSQAMFALSKLIDIFLKTLAMGYMSQNERKEEFTLPAEDQKVIDLYSQLKDMAPRAGLEPATERLTAACSTTELPRNKKS
jgi:hypothetical protein